MRFVATLNSRIPTGHPHSPTIGTPSSDYRKIIEAPNWVDARRYAQTIDPNSVVVSATPADAQPTDVELRWIGHDGAEGGGPNAKRLQHRSREPRFSTRDAETGWQDL